jgi:hypothetical protein
MTGRERLVTASRGGETDRVASLSWPKSAGGDAVIAQNLDEIVEFAGRDEAVLFQIQNPFGLAIRAGVNLNQLHDQSPDLGAEELAQFSQQVLSQCRTALDRGADGIFYVLQGARGAYCTPMQYGGLYLENDREILQEFADANLNVIFVVGNDDLYIDFVSDLPAHVFAWDSEASTFDAAYVRTLRNGALASADLTSEILLTTGVTSVADFLIQEPIYA